MNIIDNEGSAFNPEQIFEKMRQMDGAEKVRLPPRSHEFVEGEFVKYAEGQSLTLSFPLYEKYNNPVGIVLGGFIPLFFDSTMGPFSYLVAKKPTTSLDLNTTFLRPAMAADKEIMVTASLINLSKSYVLLEGKALNPQKKLVATATSRMKIIHAP